MNEFYKNGLAPDPRSLEEKAKDWTHAPLAGGSVVNWKEKPKSEWKKYVPREQDGSLSCCGQGSAKAVEILTGIVMSAHPPYRRRANFPEGGMYLQNVGEVWRVGGSTTELLDPSQFQNETTMNRDIAVPTPTKIGSYKFAKNEKDIDEIAEIVELYGHCVMIVHANSKEWTDKPVYKGGAVNFGHCITAVDYFLVNGEKVLLIEDSTGHFNTIAPEKVGQRLITSDFLIKRFVGAMYFFMPIDPDHYVFTKILSFGMNNDDVQQLQKRLNKLGFKVANSGSGSTGYETTYFGNATLSAVKKLQTAHGLQATGVVDALTNNVLNGTPNPKYIFTKTLFKGLTDNAVKELQIKLNALGFTVASSGAGSKGMETTYFGDLTLSALKKFQTAKGLTPDGVFGAKTIAIINTL